MLKCSFCSPPLAMIQGIPQGSLQGEHERGFDFPIEANIARPPNRIRKKREVQFNKLAVFY